MYEDLEEIATLKFNGERESISGQTRERVKEMRNEYAALAGSSGVRSGPHEASIGRTQIEGGDRLGIGPDVLKDLAHSQVELTAARKSSLIGGAQLTATRTNKPQNIMIYGHFGKKASVAMKEIEARIDLYNLSHSTNAANGPPALEKVKEVLNRGESPGPPVASGQPYSHDDNQERGGGREKPETASTSEPPLKETIWTKIWSWGAVSVLDSLILAGWMTFMTSGHLQAADGFLFVGAALFLAKFWTWEEARRQSPPRKWALQATVTLVSLGLVLMAALWNHDVNRTASNNQSEQSTAGKTPAILNDPGHDAGKEISTIAPTTRKRVITTAERVKAIISQQLSVDSKQIKLEDDFEMDLGATPADVYFVMLALEQEYDIKILSSESKNLHTVGETIDYIEAREKRKQQKQAKLQNRAEP